MERVAALLPRRSVERVTDLSSADMVERAQGGLSTRMSTALEVGAAPAGMAPTFTQDSVDAAANLVEIDPATLRRNEQFEIFILGCLPPEIKENQERVVLRNSFTNPIISLAKRLYELLSREANLLRFWPREGAEKSGFRDRKIDSLMRAAFTREIEPELETYLRDILEGEYARRAVA